MVVIKNRLFGTLDSIDKCSIYSVFQYFGCFKTCLHATMHKCLPCAAEFKSTYVCINTSAQICSITKWIYHHIHFVTWRRHLCLFTDIGGGYSGSIIMLIFLQGHPSRPSNIISFGLIVSLLPMIFPDLTIFSNTSLLVIQEKNVCLLSFVQCPTFASLVHSIGVNVLLQ